MNFRLVIPLTPTEKVNEKIVQKLCPTISIDGEKFVLVTNQMTTVPKSILKSEVDSLEHYRYQIMDAIDMLITGI